MSLNDIVSYIKDKSTETINAKVLEYEEEQNKSKNSLNSEYQLLLDQKLSIVKKEVEEHFKGKLLTLKIEERKKSLAFRKNIIRSIEDKVKNSFRSLLGDQEYYAFIKDMIQSHSNDGDIIYLGKDDALLLDKLKSDVSKNLTYKETVLSAGIIIDSKNYNLNYSLDALFNSKEKELQQLIWAKLDVLS